MATVVPRQEFTLLFSSDNTHWKSHCVTVLCTVVLTLGFVWIAIGNACNTNVNREGHVISPTFQTQVVGGWALVCNWNKFAIRLFFHRRYILCNFPPFFSLFFFWINWQPHLRTGQFGTKSFKMYFVNPSSNAKQFELISPWHDIPLSPEKDIFHFITEIPKGWVYKKIGDWKVESGTKKLLWRYPTTKLMGGITW